MTNLLETVYKVFESVLNLVEILDLCFYSYCDWPRSSHECPRVENTIIITQGSLVRQEKL